MTEDDPGVPDAVARALRALESQVGAPRLDRLWIFPPLRNGRRETGVVAAGCYTESPRHLLVTLAYRSEETGKGVAFESTFQEEGEAPADRLPRIMEGVVRRLDGGAGNPRSARVDGDPDAFREIVQELDPHFGTGNHQ